MTLQLTYDRLIELLLLLLLVFTPLAYGAVHSGSIAIFEIIAALMAMLWIFKMLSLGRLEFIRNPIIPCIFLFIGYVFLQYFSSQYAILNTQYSIRSIYPWATKAELLKLISYAMIFFVTLNTIRTRHQIIRVLSVIIIMGFFMSIFYLMRYFGASAPRGFINSDHFSAYLGMIIPIALGFLFAGNTPGIARSAASRVIARNTESSVIARSPLTTLKATKQSYPRILLFFTIIIMSVALFFTMSRGGMFSFVAALVFIALLVSTRRSIKKKGWIILAIAVFIILVIAWLGATPVIERILSVKAEIASRYFGGRLPIWQGTIGIIKDNLIFGTGLGTFNYIFPKYQPLSIINKHYTYAHSDFLELLSEVGIVGFALFMVCGLWSVVYLFKHFYRRHDPWVVGISLCIFGSLTAIFIHSFTDFNLHIPANAVLLVIILALFTSILNVNKTEVPVSAIASRPKPDDVISLNIRITPYLTATLSVCLFVVYIIAVIRPAMAAHYASLRESSVIAKKVKKVKKVTVTYGDCHLFIFILRAIHLDPTNADYHYKLGRLYGKSKAYELQLAEYHAAVRLNPTNSQYHQSLAWAYGQINKVSQAQHEFEVAIELSPTYYYPYQVYATWLFNHPTKENIEKGVQIYKKAVVLNPKLADKALADYFKVEKRYVQLKKILSDTPENHYKVMAMLLDAGLWEESEFDFKKDMEAASYKYPYYKAIADNYEKKGERIKSIEILADYLKIDPNCADAHFYIADRLAYMKPVNWQEVFLHHERALALAPENTFYREWYARHLFYAKRYNDAIVELEEVVAKDWWNIELHRLLGDWYKSVGRIKDADVMYAEASRVSEHLKSEKK